MKRDFSELKKSKPFYLFDLMIYGLSAALIIAIFAIVFFAGKGTATNGFYVMIENTVVAEYRFDDGKLKINDGYSAHFSEKENGGGKEYEIYFYPDTENKNDYNLIAINVADKTVRITASTCAGHDCEKQKITADGGFIYCAPHKLKITPTGLNDPVSG